MHVGESEVLSGNTLSARRKTPIATSRSAYPEKTRLHVTTPVDKPIFTGRRVRVEPRYAIPPNYLHLLAAASNYYTPPLTTQNCLEVSWRHNGCPYPFPKGRQRSLTAHACHMRP